MPTRSGDGFSFPVRKFDDDVGLFKNFKYLEQWLRRLGQGGASLATVGVHENGQDVWSPGLVEWGRDDPASVTDPDGIIIGFSGTNDFTIHVVPGTYVVTFTIDINASTLASSFEWSNWITNITHTTAGGASINGGYATNIIQVGTNTTAVSHTLSVTQSFTVVGADNEFFAASSSLNSSDGFGTEVGDWFLEGFDPGGVSDGTNVTFLKVG